MVTNTNFPAPLQVLALLGTVFAIVVLGALAMYGGLTKRSWTKLALSGIGVVIGAYILLLFVFSGLSKETVLKIGEEKHFCEIDCHIAYSVAGVRGATVSRGGEPVLVVELRTRFDPATISATRPRDAPLTPNPRTATLVDESGRTYPAVNRSELQSVANSPDTFFGQSLRPGESYVSLFGYRIPSEARGLRLLIAAADGPENILIGSELSFFHKKTYFEISRDMPPSGANIAP
jgi:hypothetical protein